MLSMEELKPGEMDAAVDIGFGGFSTSDPCGATQHDHVW